MIRRNNQESKQRSLDRRKREDDAARLIDEVRRLASLDIEIDDGGNRYIKRIVVERAPALFDLPCPEKTCTNGGHDITRAVMQALRASATRFEGEDMCRGEVPAGRCGHVIKFVATAVYRRA
jgi:hypothetical protein